MYKSKKRLEKESNRGEILSITLTVKYLEGIIKKHKKNPVDTFLQMQIVELLKKQRQLKKHGESL